MSNAALPVTTRDLANDILARIEEVIGAAPRPVPLHAPEFDGSEWAMVKDCLDSGWVSSVGAYVERFEAEVARLCGAAHGVAAVNGTAALQIALQVAGVRPGDEVLLPSLTFVATANAVRHAGAVPHFVDSAHDTLGLDPAALEAHLRRVARPGPDGPVNGETGALIRAVVPMHVFGHPVEMDALLALAERWGLIVVEDAAEALGSRYRGRPCGGLGRIAALSFNGNKIVTTGGGGAIVTSDPELASRARHLTTTAKMPHRWAFEHDEVGYNYRLPNLNAALGCAQLEQLAHRLACKRRLSGRYLSAFAGMEGAAIFPEPPGCDSNHWLNTLLLSPGQAHRRDALLDRLNEAGLQCRPAWTPMHRLPMYRDCPRAPLPVTEDLAARIINLPSSAVLGA